MASPYQDIGWAQLKMKNWRIESMEPVEAECNLLEDLKLARIAKFGFFKVTIQRTVASIFKHWP